MSAEFRIYGSEMSPYSVKVRSWFRFKGLPHRWLLRSPENRAEYQKHARLPLVPLVITSDDRGIQDSTPIIETLEAEHPNPGIHPHDPVSRFVSYLLEEFGDEWGNKWMFHFRWARPVDQESAAGRIARSMNPAADEQAFGQIRDQVRARMVDRVWFVGSGPTTAPQIEQSFATAITLLQRHLAGRAYLFGGRPAFADFGLWAQLYECWTDPTAGALIEGRAPGLIDWLHRMTWPRVAGDFEAWPALEPTLLPFLQSQVAGAFLPWTRANADAVARNAEEFTVELAGGTWTQRPQKYHTRSWATLKRRYAELEARSDIDALLDRVGGLAAFQPD